MPSMSNWMIFAIGKGAGKGGACLLVGVTVTKLLHDHRVVADVVTDVTGSELFVVFPLRAHLGR